MINKLEIENGKYQIENNNGIVKVYRYGELWLDGVTKFELCLIQRIEELEQQNERYREVLTFYAEESNYDYDVRVDSISYVGDQSDMKFYRLDSAILNDRGEKARQALEGEE